VFDIGFTGKVIETYNLVNERLNWDDGVVLPCLFTGCDRLGWLRDFMDHLTDICIAFILFLRDVADFIDDILDVIDMFVADVGVFFDLLDLFLNPDDGNTDYRLIPDIIREGCDVVDGILAIIDLLKPGECKESLEQVYEEFVEMRHWWNQDPRPDEAPIGISGDIFNLQDSAAIVTVDCREKRDMPCTGSGTSRVITPFDVDSTKSYPGDSYLFRNCMLTVVEEYKNEIRDISSPSCISFAAPGGSLRYSATFKDVEDISKQKSCQLRSSIPLLNMLQRLLDHGRLMRLLDRPLF
jgi:hypothetical protein